MNTNSKKIQSKSEKLEKELDSLFSTKSDDMEFEKMVVNSDLVAIATELMDLKGIKSQKELAALLDISPAHLSKIFSSDKMFNVEFIVKLQRVFKTKIVFNANTLIKNKLENDSVIKMSSENINQYNDFYTINHKAVLTKSLMVNNDQYATN